MPTYPILANPDFFSDQIKKYLNSIATSAGRHIVCIDLKKTGIKGVEAQIHGSSTIPVVAIFLDISQISPSKYRPYEHDSLIAHEITHLQLWSEGWSQIEQSLDMGQISIEKVNAVSNWLTDPIINRRIANFGFSMALNRTQEIIGSIRTLELYGWSSALFGQGLPYIDFIRYFVSYCLEPEIPDNLKDAFREAFKKDLPDLYTQSVKLLDIIERNGFDTPEKYKNTVHICLQAWGVDTKQIEFREHQKATIEQQQAWIFDNNNPNDPPEDQWQ